ncbi:glycosyltransferase [Halobacillus litoralis]|uniref:Glycosyltransferase n=1 Tax=Halobacillus litoralis TaxID=45668 RepID=A0A845F7N7_9BACI|nr:glycosyltransferase [Halobacillus litoralis]MYL69909.1 glycosyltransferase [Halobacillus litoralis]
MKKSILITVYNMEIGGIERSLINLLESFDYNRFEVDLLVFEHTGEFMDLIPEQVRVLPEIKSYSVFRRPIKDCVKEGHVITSFIRVVSKFQAGIKARRMKLIEGSGYIQMQLAMKNAVHFLPKLKAKYDVAISYAWPHEIVAERVPADLKIAWIHTDYSKLEIDHRLDLLQWAKFDHIISISEDVTRTFIDQYPSLEKRVHLMENISSPSFIMKRAEATINEWDSGNFSILSVGRLSFVKGYDRAVKALKILHDRGYTTIKWYVVGYGGYRKELVDLIKEHNLENHFVLLDKKINPYPYMKLCDLYVQPSRYEGKAVTVTEAMILQKPILLTNYPTANSQVIDGYNGIICGQTPEEIADSIQLLFEDDYLRIRLKNNIDPTTYGNTSEVEKLYAIIEDKSSYQNDLLMMKG